MTTFLRQFFRLEASGGILLIIAAIIAMCVANSPLGESYQNFLNYSLGMSVAHWINDGLMAVFFLIIGLEVKRELMVGSLNSKDKALFPTVAAVGGMLAPALVYLAFNGDNELTRQGWAIPAATDIAFAVGVLALLGKRVPTSLKVFLLALAIIDDLGAVVIIALFYTSDIAITALGVAVLAVIAMAILNKRGVANLTPYLLVGFILWVAILKSGVHATLAGVIIGFFIPLEASGNKKPLLHLEHTLHPWVTYLILPLFAFANAGVSLQGITIETLTSPLPLGIALGLLLGKPLGIFTFCLIAVKLKLARLPDDIRFSHVFAISILCGIGFTMSMFIATLAFENIGPEYGIYARLGILIGSIIAAVLGYILLRLTLKKPSVA